VTLKKGSYYYVNTVCGNRWENSYGRHLAKWDSAGRCTTDGFWCIFVNLKNQQVTIWVDDQASLKMRVGPVSKAFNKYLKLTEQK